MEQKKERNYGIDLLKILSMLMVTSIHIMCYGGIVNGESGGVGHDAVVWLIYSGVYGCVNLYAMITGYLYEGRKIGSGNLIALYITVLSYAVLIPIVFVCIGRSGRMNIVYGCVPLMTREYWYFSAYCGMYLFIPLLNRLVENKTLCRKILVGLLWCSRLLKRHLPIRTCSA